MRDAQGNELEIDVVYFREPIAMIPREGQGYLANSGMVYIKNAGNKHEYVDIIVIGGLPFLRRTPLDDSGRSITMSLVSPDIKHITWRKKDARASTKKR